MEHTNGWDGICIITPTGPQNCGTSLPRVPIKMSQGQAYAMKDRSTTDRVVFKCIQSKANVEVYMGEKKITSLILEWK